ncbi:MAG: hypothetical protein HC919_15635 [Oscillatoriales cyanobacterium SM2_2_1]|nr:hypothetical protein [Oscillatoriales cyanobacterium SM2_2_1]
MAGKSGTLASRTFTIPGSIQGKTGTATGISSLAGFLIPAAITPKITFAIVINHSSATLTQDRELITTIVNQLGRLQSPRCGSPK